MKKIIYLLPVFVIAANLNAQEIPDRKMDKPGMHHDMHKGGMKGRRDKMRMAMKDLNLTEQQKQQLKKNHEDLKARLEALKKEDNITVKEYRTRMENLRKEQKSSFQSVLTGEQKAILEKKKTEAKRRFEQMDKKRAEQMKTRLGLSEEQAAQMKKNREELQGKIKAIREDKSLNDEKKREAIRTEMKSQKEKNGAILTEDQKKKMKEMRERKGKYPEDKPADKKTI